MTGGHSSLGKKDRIVYASQFSNGVCSFGTRLFTKL